MGKGVTGTIIIAAAAILVAVLAIASYQPPGLSGNSTLGSLVPCLLRAEGGGCGQFWIKTTSATITSPQSSSSVQCCPVVGPGPLGGQHATEGGTADIRSCPPNVPPCPPTFQTTSTTSQTCVCPAGMKQSGNACVADCKSGQSCPMFVIPCKSQPSQPAISCSDCNNGVCLCRLSCQSGTLDFFNDSACNTIPMKERVFFNSQLTIPVKGLVYLKLYCDEGGSSACTSVSSSNNCNCPSGYIKNGNVCSLPCRFFEHPCLTPDIVCTGTITTTSQVPQCDPVLCQRYMCCTGRECPLGNPMWCSGCTQSICSTTTTTTTTQTCSCPEGYNKYGNVCTPTCYFNRPPCLTAPIACQ